MNYLLFYLFAFYNDKEAHVSNLKKKKKNQ